MIILEDLNSIKSQKRNGGGKRMGKVLSIAVPSYNVEKYLNKALESYADSRLEEDLEVLIVNDGSTDGTVEIAEKYVKRFPKLFKLINKENGGHGSAVNAGINNATGKYFRIIDGDDWVNTENLIKLLQVMKTIDSDIVVDEKREVHMLTGDTQFFPMPGTVEELKEYAFEDVCMQEKITPYIMMHTISVKTEMLRENKIQLLEHVFYVDYEFIVKATCASKSVTFVKLEVYQYLVGNVNQSVSSQNYVKRYSHHDKVVKEVMHFAKERQYTGVLQQYIDEKIKLVIHNHYNISLIFNKNRKEGYAQAKEFRKYLKENYLNYYKITNKRYWMASVLHVFGVDSEKLNKLMGRK